MPSVLIIEKLGKITETNINSETLLYKKAGYKTSEGFEIAHRWKVPVEEEGLGGGEGMRDIILYAKTKGRAGTENKYEFPPPVDTILFYGNCILVKKNEKDEIENLTNKEWENIYDYLYGGFEDLEETENDEEEDDEEEEEDDEDDDEILNDYDGVVVDEKRIKKPKELIINLNQTQYFDISSELTEEPYDE